eukprot:sb/3467151/
MLGTVAICCANVLCLEKIMKEAPNSSALVLIVNYILIIGETLLRKPSTLSSPSVPLSNYLIITVLNFSHSLLNNMALAYNVDMPTVLIIRSGSILANMAVSIVAFRRSYPISKYLSVTMVTVGIVMATLASAEEKKREESEEGYGRWLIGMGMLIYSLFASSVMGVFQEKLFAKFGRDVKEEALFYSHFLGLPNFIFQWSALISSVGEFSASPPLEMVPGVPRLWALLLLNVALQNIGLRGIYWLLSEWSSLAVTMVTTVRKFISLLLSIFLFSNPFTSSHWIGSVLVMIGSGLFALPEKKKEEKTE